MDPRFPEAVWGDFPVLYKEVYFDRRTHRIDADRAAVVLIDMNNDCLDPDCAIAVAGMDVTPLRAIVPTVDRLLAGARKASVDVIYTTADMPPGEEATEAWLREAEAKVEELSRTGAVTKGAAFVERLRSTYTGEDPYALRIVDELAPQEGDIVVRKLTEDGFMSDAFTDVVTRERYDYLLIAGVVTDMCVMSTARSAVERGFKCVLVSDASAAFEPEMQAAAEKLFAGIFGEVWTTDRALEVMSEAAPAAQV